MRPVTAAALAALLFALPPAATASPPPPTVEQICDRAREEFAAGRDEDACATLGAAAAVAHKKGDLLGEQQISRALAAALGERTERPAAMRPGESMPEPFPRTRLDPRDALSIVLAELDPEHAGAFVSAPSIARVLLYRATETGDDRSIEEADRVLGRYAKTKKCGAAAPLLARYASGLVALRTEALDEAAAALQTALEGAVRNRWPDLAAHVSVELAAAHLAADDPAAAEDVVRLAASLFEGEVDPAVATVWKVAATKRLGGASGALAIIDGIVGPLASGPLGGIPIGGDVSMGGVNNMGGRKSTDLGKAFPRLSGSRPMVTVERQERGFALRLAFAPAEKPFQAWRQGEHAWAHEGLGLAFAGGAVALESIDLENQVKAPSVRVRPPSSRAYHLLAPGETLGITKTGRVTITD